MKRHQNGTLEPPLEPLYVGVVVLEPPLKPPLEPWLEPVLAVLGYFEREPYRVFKDKCV